MMQSVAIYHIKWNHGQEVSRKLVKVFTDAQGYDFSPLDRAKLELAKAHNELIGDASVDSTRMPSDREFVSVPTFTDRCLCTVIEDVFIDRNGQPRRYSRSS